jgi:hypothetical protein
VHNASPNRQALRNWNMLVERFLQSNPEDQPIGFLRDEYKTDLHWLKGYFGDRGQKETLFA